MIKVGTLAKIRRLYFRDKQSIKEICRQTGLSRNTVRTWLRESEMVEPKYPVRRVVTKLDNYAETLRTWLKADSTRNKRERRTKGQMWLELRALGYTGSYGRLCAFARAWKASVTLAATKGAFIPLKFHLGEAFQFDWSTEYTFIAGLRRRVELAHTKLCASRAFWLVAYPGQGHEMLFDAHARAFEAFGGVPQRGIYDNMKTIPFKHNQSPLGQRLLLHHLSVHHGMFDKRNFDSISNTLLIHHNIWVYVDAFKTANDLVLARDKARVPAQYLDCIDFIANVFQSGNWQTSIANNKGLLDAVAPNEY